MGESVTAEVFKNEILVKLNQINRIVPEIPKGRLPATINRSKSLGKVVNLLYGITGTVVNILSLILLLFLSVRPSGNYSGTAFIYTDKRLLKFSTEGFPALCVGLHKILLRFGRGHLYRNLRTSDVLFCLREAVQMKEVLTDEIRNSMIGNLNGEQLLSLSGVGYFRALDLMLARAAITKFKSIQCAGHFDVYTALISKLRENGEIEYFSGVQHGLYEYFYFGKPMRLFFDEYELLFRESELYFRQYICGNSACEIICQEKMSAFQTLGNFKKAAAIALQSDDFESDAVLMQHLTPLVMAGFVVIGYVHPATSRKQLRVLQLRFPYITFEQKRRYANVDIIITRYSTLAMDYVAMGVPAIFWAARDRVCVSMSENSLIHEIAELDGLMLSVNKMLAEKGK